MNLFKISQYGVFTTAISALASLALLFLINNTMGVEASSDIRYVYNWALSLSIILCFGWDSAIVRVSQREAKQIYRLTSGAIPIFSLLLCLIYYYYSTHKIILMLALALSFVSVLLKYNYYRSNNDFKKYILGINIYDKIFRLLLFVVLIYFFDNNVLLLFTVLYVVCQIRLRKFNLTGAIKGWGIYIKGVIKPINLGFLLAGAYMIFMSRGIYLTGSTLNIEELRGVDFVLLLSAFLFVPIQTISKFHEVSGNEDEKVYLTNESSRAQLKVVMMESIIFLSILFIVLLLDEMFLGEKISSIILVGVLSIIVLMSTFPNPAQILTANKSFSALFIIFVIVSTLLFSSGYIELFVNKALLFSTGVILTLCVFTLANFDFLSRNFILIRIFRTIIFLVVLYSLYLVSV